MRAAVALRDVVGEGEDVLVIGIVPFERDVDADPVLLGRDRNRFGEQRLLVAVEIFDEGGNAAFVEQIVLGDLLVALVAQQNVDPRIEESEFAIAVFQLVEIEFDDVLEGLGRGQEGHAGALLEAVLVADAVDRRSIAGDLERLDRIAVLEAHPVLLAVAPDREFEPFAQRIDHRDADPVKPARDLVGVVVIGVLELAARVELGHDDLGRRDAFFLVHVHRNAAAIVLDRDRTIGVEFDQHEVAMPR